MFEKLKETRKDAKNSSRDTPRENYESGDSTQRQSSSTQMHSRSSAVIGQSIKIKGTVSGGESLVIEGTVEGSVDLAGHDLTIGQTGHVTADLQAKNVKIEGQVKGDITGSEKVIVSKSGRVHGNIVAPRVTLEDGAKFKGSIDMDPGEVKPKAVPANKTETKPMGSLGEVNKEAG